MGDSAIALGGAFGNFIDRVRAGYVIDFIDISFYPAVFNLADSAIVVGAGLIILGIAAKEFIKKEYSVPAAQIPDHTENSLAGEDKS